MKISDAERLMLLMLCDIYDSANALGDFDTDFIRSAVFGEKLWSIPWKYSGIPFDDQDVPGVVKEVLDILDMWSLIEYSYTRLGPEDKLRLQEQAAPFGTAPQFRGFDGNSETSHMSTAEFLVNQLGRFVEFKNRNFNSHSPLLGAYRRMLDFYLKVRGELAGGPLGLDDLTTILREQVHPENRGQI